MGVPSCGGRAPVTGRLRRKGPDRSAPLVGPSGSRLVSSAGRGRGQSWGRRGRKGGTLWSGSCSPAQLRRPSAALRVLPLRPPKMIPTALLLALLLVGQAEALGEPQICYILDAILFLYGIILTLLYCRLKIQVRKAAVAYQKSDGIYTGLSPRNQETYETLKHQKPTE
ncbi:PREDICTED: high affinity immunoglobulin epsilon receptor subunit gamma [Myotis brandtii]|nr:PREDICTED: high affinity immunoglobulin epsilon receptor subunit gamma [Myotis brandtii]